MIFLLFFPAIQLEIRACARNFVVVSGGLSWLRSLIASCADDFASSGPLADQGLLLHLLALLKVTLRFASSYWLEQANTENNGEMDASSSEEDVEEETDKQSDDGNEAEEEADAGKRNRLTLEWECNQTMLCLTSAAVAWLGSHPSGGGEENGEGGIGGGSAEVALALVEVITAAAAHAQLGAPLDTLLGLAQMLQPLSSSSRAPPSNKFESLEALAVLIASTVAHPHSCHSTLSVEDGTDEAGLAWAVNFATGSVCGGELSPPLLAACSQGALRLVALCSHRAHRAFTPLSEPPPPPTWLLAFAARTVATSSATAPSRLTKPLIAAAVASAAVLASMAHSSVSSTKLSAASAAASASSSMVAVNHDDGDGISPAVAAVSARVRLPCDGDADESWVDQVVASLALQGADATSDALSHLAEASFGPGGWLE
jgi:hypothetical protein